MPGRRNCLEDLRDGLKPFGIDVLDVLEASNLFQNGPVTAGAGVDGGLAGTGC